MSNITIYLEDTLEERLRRSAQEEGISVSKLVARMVEQKTAETWPKDFLALAGSWTDLERPEHGEDMPRESL